jgi:hypothetical protein
MRHFHPGLPFISELHFEDVEAYLAQDFAPTPRETQKARRA